MTTLMPVPARPTDGLFPFITEPCSIFLYPVQNVFLAWISSDPHSLTPLVDLDLFPLDTQEFFHCQRIEKFVIVVICQS